MQFCSLLFFIIYVLLFESCSEKKQVTFQKEIPAVESLQQQSEIFKKRIEKVDDNIYVAIGYGLANSILIEGKDSVIIVDCMESIEAGIDVKRAFDSITTKPLKAIIYTHFHTDHTSGATALAGNYNPDVYAQELLPHYLDQTSAVVRHITEKRSYRMFGVYLDSSALVNCGIGPQLHIHEGSELGVIRPNKLFKDSLDITIAGVHIKLFHAPGETPDQLMVWLPETKTLLCGDNLYKTFPNLYTIRGTGYRDVNLWKNSIDKMRYLHPEIIIPSHTEIIRGADEAYNILTDYRDAIQFVHDQTVRGMNKGLTPDELAEKVILPPHLQQSPWLQEFYGKTEWSVRTVFDGYMGFFDGNPATLLPLNRKEKAKKMELLAGGKEKLSERISNAMQQHEYQWALELTDFFLTLYPDDEKIINHKIDALIALGTAQSNPNARHYYLTCALELRGLKNEGLVKPTPELVKNIPLASIFNGMAAHLNPEKSIDVNQRVLFNFTDTNKQWIVEVRKGVAEVQPFKTGEPDITIHVKEQVWKELAAKIRKPVPTYLSGEIKADGGQIAFVKFLKLFDMEEQ
jgi:alkyl sulfatase BDS1-like metallo-beta-lactamase superfamily hydrolase